MIPPPRRPLAASAPMLGTSPSPSYPRDQRGSHTAGGFECFVLPTQFLTCTVAKALESSGVVDHYIWIRCYSLCASWHSYVLSGLLTTQLDDHTTRSSDLPSLAIRISADSVTSRSALTPSFRKYSSLDPASKVRRLAGKCCYRPSAVPGIA